MNGCCLCEGWLDEADRKTSLTSLAQDQAKFGSKTALNRRVKSISSPVNFTSGSAFLSAAGVRGVSGQG